MKRKIIKLDDYTPLLSRYMSLKEARIISADFSSDPWEKRGKIYSIRGIDNLSKTKGIELIMEDLTMRDLKYYRELKRELNGLR